MPNSSIARAENDNEGLKTATSTLRSKCNAQSIFLVDKAGHLIEATGELSGIDVTSLASLIAGNAAAASGLATLLGEQKEFNITYNEGDDDNLFLTTLNKDTILVAVFSNKAASLKQIRHSVSEMKTELTTLVESELGDAQEKDIASRLTKITDEDIEELFSLE